MNSRDLIFVMAYLLRKTTANTRFAAMLADGRAIGI